MASGNLFKEQNSTVVDDLCNHSKITPQTFKNKFNFFKLKSESELYWSGLSDYLFPLRIRLCSKESFRYKYCSTNLHLPQPMLIFICRLVFWRRTKLKIIAIKTVCKWYFSSCILVHEHRSRNNFKVWGFSFDYQSVDPSPGENRLTPWGRRKWLPPGANQHINRFMLRYFTRVSGLPWSIFETWYFVSTCANMDSLPFC